MLETNHIGFRFTKRLIIFAFSYNPLRLLDEEYVNQ